MKRFESNGKTSSYIFTDHKAKVMFSQACVRKRGVYPSMHSGRGVYASLYLARGCIRACTWAGVVWTGGRGQGDLDKVVFGQEVHAPPPYTPLQLLTRSVHILLEGILVFLGFKTTTTKRRCEVALGDNEFN